MFQQFIHVVFSHMICENPLSSSLCVQWVRENSNKSLENTSTGASVTLTHVPRTDLALVKKIIKDIQLCYQSASNWHPNNLCRPPRYTTPLDIPLYYITRRYSSDYNTGKTIMQLCKVWRERRKFTKKFGIELGIDFSVDFYLLP